MKTWAVVSSSKFENNFNQWLSSFSAELHDYNRDPNAKVARKLGRKFHHFRELLAIIKKLEQQGDPKVIPERLLTYVTHDASGLLIFSLIYKEWRCLYLVDSNAKTCTAIEIQWMSANLQAVEKDRHKNGRKLNDLTE